MPKLENLPYYVIRPERLADWLDREPSVWWHVDGDPTLTAVVDFPCPSSELAAALRTLSDRRLVVLDNTPNSRARGEEIAGSEMEHLSNTENRHGERNFLLKWDNSDSAWLLSEDKMASESAEG